MLVKFLENAGQKFRQNLFVSTFKKWLKNAGIVVPAASVHSEPQAEKHMIVSFLLHLLLVRHSTLHSCLRQCHQFESVVQLGMRRKQVLYLLTWAAATVSSALANPN